MKKIVLAGSRIVVCLIALNFFYLATAPQFAQAQPSEQTTADNVIKALTKAFNAMDLNGCLALMTDDAVVKVVNPSDLANVTLTNTTLTYTGKQGTQSQVANFFNINFTNGFSIWATNFKYTDTLFAGPMQLAIRNFVIETEVEGTLVDGKIKTLVITDKSITVKVQPATMPASVPSTGLGQANQVTDQTYLQSMYVFAATSLFSLIGLLLLRRPKS